MRIWKEFLKLNALAALLTATSVIPREAGELELVKPTLALRAPIQLRSGEASGSIKATGVLGSTMESGVRQNLEQLSLETN